jgi:NTE family protein
MNASTNDFPGKTALILSGGGARAAYQVGVLKAIAEIQPNECSNPFPIICGTSAGAINAAVIATRADCFQKAVDGLCDIWNNLRSDMIHYVGYTELIKSSLKILGAFFTSGYSGGRPLSLLDNTPLFHLISKHIDFQNLDTLIDSGHIHALCITALGYSSGQSMNFYQGHPDIQTWQRARRIGVPTMLNHQHLMASSALPTLFPAVRIHREYYGDGALRQTAPMSAALHLGADKLLVIGVSNNRSGMTNAPRVKTTHSPSLAQIGGHLLNSAFIDAMEEDIETLERFNNFLGKLSTEQCEQINMRPVDVLYIRPSVRFDELAANHIKDLPPSMRTLLKTIGATRSGGGSSLASYLLFETGFLQGLMEYGYQDAMKMKDKIEQFLS